MEVKVLLRFYNSLEVTSHKTLCSDSMFNKQLLLLVTN